jgi:hypothetical protein
MDSQPMGQDGVRGSGRAPSPEYTPAAEVSRVPRVDFSRCVIERDARRLDAPADLVWSSGTLLAMAGRDSEKGAKAMWRSLVLDAGLDRLQTLLLGMVEGDEVSLPKAMEVSGLPAPQCEAVFEALTRAGLMIRAEGDAYVRKHLSN